MLRTAFATLDKRARTAMSLAVNDGETKVYCNICKHVTTVRACKECPDVLVKLDESTIVLKVYEARAERHRSAAANRDDHGGISTDPADCGCGTPGGRHGLE